MEEPIISVSGLRGIIGQTLTPPVAIRYAVAFASTLAEGPVVVARDSRPSGDMLARSIHAGLHAVGRHSVDAGISATPTTGFLVRHLGAAGGIQITASHNPPPYNGLKLFAAEGRVISAGPGREVLERYRAATADWAAHDRLGTVHSCGDPARPHLEAVLKIADVPRIRSRGFKVVLDSNHGAGGGLGRRLLEALGCQVTVLGEQADGLFAHPAEPTAENLATVLAAVPQAGADIGFCQDPDADRLALIDASGRYVGEEYTVAICAKQVLASRQGPLVTNCSTSRMTEDIAAAQGAGFFRSAVGEANVADAMLAHGAIFGGEGNGGPIDPRVGLIRDSFVGMAIVLDAMAARGLSVAELADELPRYEIVKTKIALPQEKVKPGLERLAAHFSSAKADWLDGLRLDWPDGWLLVRASNTEPIVRAIAEAPSAHLAQSRCEEAARVLSG